MTKKPKSTVPAHHKMTPENLAKVEKVLAHLRDNINNPDRQSARPNWTSPSSLEAYGTILAVLVFLTKMCLEDIKMCTGVYFGWEMFVNTVGKTGKSFAELERTLQESVEFEHDEYVRH